MQAKSGIFDKKKKTYQNSATTMNGSSEKEIQMTMKAKNRHSNNEAKSKKHQARQSGLKNSDCDSGSLLHITSAGDQTLEGTNMGMLLQPGCVVKNGAQLSDSLLQMNEANFKSGNQAICKRKGKRLRASLYKAHHYDSIVNCKTR